MKRYAPERAEMICDDAGEWVKHSDHEAALAAAVHAAEVATWAKAGAEHNAALAEAVKKEREECARVAITTGGYRSVDIAQAIRARVTT